VGEPSIPEEMCPVCASHEVVLGTAGFSGDDGWVTSFTPKGLKLFTIRNSVNLNDGQLLRACGSCGHVCSSIDPAELRELLQRSLKRHSPSKAGGE
jgi:hypothetical protein